MDLHPIFVHFPIGLLTLYSVLEILRRWTKASFWMPLRAVLVWTGTLGAFVSLSTGEGAEHLFQNRELHNVLETHSLLANVTTWLYVILAVSYAFVILDQHAFFDRAPVKIRTLLRPLNRVAHSILHTPISVPIALLGFLGLMLTGALGGILAYGPDFDPITSLVYSVLFGS